MEACCKYPNFLVSSAVTSRLPHPGRISMPSSRQWRILQPISGLTPLPRTGPPGPSALPAEAPEAFSFPPGKNPPLYRMACPAVYFSAVRSPAHRRLNTGAYTDMMDHEELLREILALGADKAGAVPVEEIDFEPSFRSLCESNDLRHGMAAAGCVLPMWKGGGSDRPGKGVPYRPGVSDRGYSGGQL